MTGQAAWIDAIRSNGWVHLSLATQATMRELDACLRSSFPMANKAVGMDLRPLDRASARPGSMSSFTGMTQQPFHTDAAFVPVPPRYLVIQCVERGEGRCPTQILALKWKSLREAPPPLLTEPVWVARGGGLSPFYTQVLSLNGQSDGLIRFDPLCMRPSSTQPEMAARTLAVLEDYATPVDIDWKRGDALVIDNWRCLHRRADASTAPSRLLRRWTYGASNGLVG